ncbi:hypothetical protein L596_017609 [Steinernema carpocapsae]|uniref:Uncharacterized protein n=1 Tax=Steinernema carpocapsae TaxID=34508 RepID=A0A4U5N2F4_STECR|nr:hypothetical protein L596_017609 [Steinernema carpocapsae]
MADVDLQTWRKTIKRRHSWPIDQTSQKERLNSEIRKRFVDLNYKLAKKTEFLEKAWTTDRLATGHLI